MEASTSSKSRSKYYAAPTSMPTPRKTKKRGCRIGPVPGGPVPGPGENSDKELSGNAEEPSEEASEDGDGSHEATSSTKAQESGTQTLWKRKGTEVVIATVRTNNGNSIICLRHNDLISLRPHNLLNGEAMEFFIQATLSRMGGVRRLYVLHHFVIGVILFGETSQISRQSLKTVDFDQYDGVIGFVNVNNNHWKFVYLHAPTSQIFIIDPADPGIDLEETRKAAKRFRKYFRTRFNLNGQKDWLTLAWKPATISHTTQRDGTSCGVFVMEMARQTIHSFPAIPEELNIDSQCKNIARLREDMAEEMLLAAESKMDFCCQCGMKVPSAFEIQTKDILWIECGKCNRWFHASCLGMTAASVPEKDTAWYCEICL
ncbi:uncharacterized protein LOC132455264 [Gadus macrocephalus]|uniref:uncharacterized protein LOC132455264 n=1 Tax=Gadus macrocephalus TaxID=80720 RepID=UPI0028CB83A4|nr:uncharacterized protein LOC132455264 [Gadus macrocephalus]